MYSVSLEMTYRNIIYGVFRTMPQVSNCWPDNFSFDLQYSWERLIVHAFLYCFWSELDFADSSGVCCNCNLCYFAICTVFFILQPKMFSFCLKVCFCVRVLTLNFITITFMLNLCVVERSSVLVTFRSWCTSTVCIYIARIFKHFGHINHQITFSFSNVWYVC